VEKPALPPGHFRATPEMLSLIGCGEAEMTVILRALGYRVHQPPEGVEGPTTFSMRPRFQRERDEQADRRGPRPEWKRRQDDRPPRRERRQGGTPGGGLQPAAEAGSAPGGEDRPFRRSGPREERRERLDAMGKIGTPRGPGERPDGGGRRGSGPPRERRDRDRERGPEVRLVATTEKQGDRPASDSPFAKLLELKLGKK
jgi:ATP-dependent RNA helicase SUPV3L1/SUV3